MSLQDRLLTLAAVRYMMERLDAVATAEKAAIKAEVGGRMGAAGAVLPDGTEAATVWITKPTRHGAKAGGVPYVSNPQVFTEWVKTFRPSAIVESVRSTDIPSILADSLELDGEVPPGCSLSEAEPAYTSGGGVVTVKQSEEQKGNLLRALLAGAIPLPSFAPQIEAGSDDEH